MAEEALATFQSLLDSVPGWISELETILTTATAQQSVLAAEHAALTAQEQSSQITFDFLRLAQRKRKTASVCSKADSRRSDRARRQCLATIYYDSSAQKRFETLVRGIGSSRNGIRKAKLSMKVDSFALIGSDISDSSDGEETIKGLGTFTYRRRTSYRQGASDTQSFDNVDAALEKAQMSCEKAAHSILREGDCSADITQARQNFESALDIVRTELPRLTKRADKAVQRRLDEKVYGSEEESQVTQHSGVFSLPSDGMLEVDSDEQVESDGEDFNVFSMKLPPSLSKFGSMRQPQARLGTV